MKKDEKDEIIEKALRFILKANKEGVSNYKIAKDTNITERTIGNYVNGTTKPTFANAKILIDYFIADNRKSHMEGLHKTIREQEIIIDSKDKPHYEITNFKPKPYIDSIYATLGVPNGFALAVKSDECEQISIPFVNDYDFSIRGRGDSMINRDNPQKSIGEGDIIACKLWNSRTHIRWGEVYCLATSDGVVIKKIMPADQEGYIKCVSYNEFDGYKPYELPLDEIHDWALVVSVIHISNW